MTDTEKKLTEGLQKYLPKEALPTIVEWLVKYKVFLKITQKRVSKLGDYRPPSRGYGHRISINHDLNPYSFLDVMVHELAHLVTYEQYKRTVKPHGREWKSNYQDMMRVFLGKEIFPADLEKAIEDYLQNPSASNCSDEHLYKAFKKYDAPSTTTLPHGFKKTFVEELAEGTKFLTATGQVFVKGIKLRKRYQCKQVNTGRLYVFSPIVEVYYRPFSKEE